MRPFYHPTPPWSEQALAEQALPIDRRKAAILAALSVGSFGIVLGVMMFLAFLLAGCTTDPYRAPAVSAPGRAEWVWTTPAQVAALCGSSYVAGCTLRYGANHVVVTQFPTATDSEFGAVMAHEAAHVLGWSHPERP